MTTTTSVRSEDGRALTDSTAAAQDSAADVLSALAVGDALGLSGAGVLRRRARWGPNAVSSYKARFWPALWHQLRSPLLVLCLFYRAASTHPRTPRRYDKVRALPRRASRFSASHAMPGDTT